MTTLYEFTRSFMCTFCVNAWKSLSPSFVLVGGRSLPTIRSLATMILELLCFSIWLQKGDQMVKLERWKRKAIILIQTRPTKHIKRNNLNVHCNEEQMVYSNLRKENVRNKLPASRLCVPNSARRGTSCRPMSPDSTLSRGTPHIIINHN